MPITARRALVSALFGASLVLTSCQKVDAQLSQAQQDKPARISKRDLLPNATLATLQRLPQANPYHKNAANPTHGIDPNKPTVVKFWASWCPLCLATLQEANDWAKQYPQINVISVVSPGQLNEKSTQDFTTWYKVVAKDYPDLSVLMDSDGTLIRQFGIQVYPNFAILDKQGNLLKLSLIHI